MTLLRRCDHGGVEACVDSAMLVSTTAVGSFILWRSLVTAGWEYDQSSFDGVQVMVAAID